MPKPNHICRNPKCGKAYYACETCEEIGSWKAIACSHECYKAIMELKMKQEISQKPTDNRKNNEIDTEVNKPKKSVPGKSNKRTSK